MNIFKWFRGAADDYQPTVLTKQDALRAVKGVLFWFSDKRYADIPATCKKCLSPKKRYVFQEGLGLFRCISFCYRPDTLSVVCADCGYCSGISYLTADSPTAEKVVANYEQIHEPLPEGEKE